MLKPCFSDKQIEAGCDEAGRGCLAGPVFAAAVILDRNFRNEQLNDSKKLTEKKREELRIIIEEQALAWAVATVSPEEIDDINILNASYLAMHRAIDQLKIKPELLLIDGNRFNTYKKIPHKCIVKGDGKYMAIAAASVLAKTHRDAYMLRIHQEFPGFGWNTNKGYPTRQHKLAIYEYGLTPYHRKSFNFHLQLKIDF
ncbi:MAG: ribonuclease HII [Bacteroidetes bacterium]|nr:MAG: ribonuclease HII [Bacteroidota bacterium]RLD49360.1 MAG: ribonuclease HII [Bacteroidota bacterium]RLD71010.1 MAG: ribonuclease HII [Bacteroidota bacterium]